MKLHRHRFRAMGSPCEIQLYAADPTVGVRAICAEIERLECKYSRYRDGSVTDGINRSAGDARGVEVDAETGALLDYAAQAHAQSGGLFDITSGVLRQVWDFKSGHLPLQERIDRVLSCVGWSLLNWRAPRLILPKVGMQLDFGGYVKEYAADAAVRCARAAGIEYGLVELGGDIAVIGAHPDGAPWRVGVRHPRAPQRAAATVDLRCGAIASSGDYERYLDVGGRRYCHILNPKTGWPAQGLQAVSVIAGQCVVAGTASTIAMLKGGDGLAWLDALGLPWFAVDAAGRSWRSAAFASEAGK